MARDIDHVCISYVALCAYAADMEETLGRETAALPP